MGKGKRLRGLRANTIIIDASGEEKTISQMKDLGMKQFEIMPIGGISRLERRKEAREARADRDRVIRRTRFTTAEPYIIAARVLRIIIGEGLSIKKAREIDYRARRATMEVR